MIENSILFVENKKEIEINTYIQIMIINFL
jgi:hypothetical protein